jgi:glycosyltransferase involved in cell wall biosynthesis
MCTYNGAQYLHEQLESIARQSLLPDDLIVCDDGSMDRTTEIVQRFAATAAFPVKLCVNDQNLGSTRNFEQAIGLCTGELIALSDQDDVWRPEKLELLEAEFARRPDVGLVFADAEIVDDKLRPVGRRMWNEVGFREKEKALIKKGRALDVLLPGWSVTGATMAFRSKFRDLILPVPTNLPMIHDGWIAVIVAAVSEIAFIDKPLISYRQHSEQQIGAPRNRADLTEPQLTRLLKINLAASRANNYGDLVRITDAVTGRIRARGNQAQVYRLERRRRHLLARMKLPANILTRFSVVLRELLTLRYSQFSKGISSAVKDLVYGSHE